MFCRSLLVNTTTKILMEVKGPPFYKNPAIFCGGQRLFQVDRNQSTKTLLYMINFICGVVRWTKLMCRVHCVQGP